MPATRIEIIEHIESLIGNMTQADFGKIIGCKQGKASQLLNRSGEKRFTVEELEKIADHFNVSVDSILGRDKREKKKEKQISPREFCEVLLDLLESQYPWDTCKVKVQDTVVQYRKRNGDRIYAEEKIEKEYPAIVFSMYPDPHKHRAAYVADSQCNHSGYSESVNFFLNSISQLRPVYLNHTISEDVYKFAVEGLLKEVEIVQDAYAEVWFKEVE